MNKQLSGVKIFPSSWYYNACLQGFLEILALGLGDSGIDVIEEEILQDDGIVIIPGDLMKAAYSTRETGFPKRYKGFREVPDDVKELKRIVWWWVEKSYQEGFIRQEDREKENLGSREKIETVCRRLFNHINGFYPNLAQVGCSTDKKIEFLNKWFNLNANEADSLSCSFCGSTYELSEEDNIYQSFFTMSLSRILGSSPPKFPNFFWDGQPSLVMCKQCRSYFLCFHITERKRFFVNSDSLQVNWYLNRILYSKANEHNMYRSEKLLNALKYDSQLRKAVCSWGTQRLELVNFTGKGVDTQPLSPNVARILAIPEISNLIGRISSDLIWDCIVKEQFEYLNIILYKSLRALIKGENTEKDPEVIFNTGDDSNRIVVLIELAHKINTQVLHKKGGGKVRFFDFQSLRKAGGEAPINLGDNTGKNLVYRLLELTRLYQKAEIYHLLLRVYLSSNRKFPEILARLFEIEEEETFKNGIYAFIAGLRAAEEK